MRDFTVLGIKVKGCTFRGNNAAIFIFASNLNRGLLLKERICSFKSKFFLFRGYHFEKGFISQRISTNSSCLPFKSGRKTWQYTHYSYTKMFKSLQFYAAVLVNAVSACGWEHGMWGRGSVYEKSIFAQFNFGIFTSSAN